MAYNMPNTALTTIKAKIEGVDVVILPACEIAAKDAQIAELTSANTTLLGEKAELAGQVETLTARIAELETDAGGDGEGDDPSANE